MKAVVERIHRTAVVVAVVLIAIVLAVLFVVPLLDPGKAEGKVLARAGFTLPADAGILNVGCPSSAAFPTVTLPAGNWILSARSDANDQALKNRFVTISLDGTNPTASDLIIHMGKWGPVYIPANCPVKCYSSDGKGVLQAVEYARAQ